MSIIYCQKHDIQWDSDRIDQCPSCENEEWPECKACNGRGYIQHLAEPIFSEPCPYCEGRGYILD